MAFKSPYKGIYISWKSLKSYDDIKVFCKPPGRERQFAISIEEIHEYKVLRNYIRDNGFNRSNCMNSNEAHDLFSECLKSIATQYGLPERSSMKLTT